MTRQIYRALCQEWKGENRCCYRVPKRRGKLKNSLIEIPLEDDEKKDLLYAKFFMEVKRNVVPVVKGRAFERKWSCTNKHSKAHRRVL